MSAGPLRRATAVVGLLALAPIAGMILNGTLTPEQAAVRALLVVGAVVLIGNLARVVLESLLQRVEKDLVTDVADEPGPAASRPDRQAQQAQQSMGRRAADQGGGTARAG